MHDSIFKHIASETYILTATPLQTQYLLSAFANREKTSQKLGWVNPNIISFSGWLQKLWHHLLDAGFELPLLLSEHQQNQLWQEVIALHVDESVEPGSLVSMAKSAYRIAAEWQLTFSREDLGEVNQLWWCWRNDYISKCKEKKLADDLLWLQQLASLIASLTDEEFSRLDFPKKIILYEIPEKTELQNNLLSSINKKGVEIDDIKFQQCINEIPRNIGKKAFLNKKQELAAAARWANERLLQGDKRIACVLPHLNQEKKEIVAAFSKMPIFLHSQENFSNFPLIYSALAILSLLKFRQSTSVWSYLLRCPLVGGYESEYIPRAVLADSLYERNEFYYSVTQIIKLSLECVDFQNKLNLIPHAKEERSPLAWVEYFNNLLALFSWPGNLSLSEHEKQILSSWEDMLVEFSQLERIRSKLNLNQALSYLNQLASSWRFQFDDQKSTAIHILTWQQAQGLVFDAIWILSCQETTLPAQPRPNSILPIQRQREKNVPHASYEWELEYAVKLFQDFSVSAPFVVFSYARQDEVGEIKPSILLNALTEIEGEFLKNKAVLSASQLEELPADEHGSALTSSHLAGGSQVFQEQAECAFRGYAKSRFNIKPLDELTYGLTPKEKGIIVHQSLEFIWRSIKTQSALFEIAYDDLNFLIENSIEQSLDKILKNKKRLRGSKLIELEKIRLIKLLTAWLGKEKERSSFSILALEKSVEVNFSDLSFNLRIDRIDTLENERYFIIDYKTGNVSFSSWFDERIAQPQLPLYLVASKLPIEGLVFAQVKAGYLGFRGIAIEQAIPGVGLIERKMKEYENAKDAWDEQVKRWHTALVTLADEIKQGKAVLNPREGNTSCEACDLQMLCRIYDE